MLIENMVYRAIILRIEELEHQGAYNGNAHHLAQDLSKMVAVELLSKQQREIYNQLDRYRETAMTARHLSYVTKIPVKNISSQLRQINEKTNLVGVVKDGGRFKYYQL